MNLSIRNTSYFLVSLALLLVAPQAEGALLFTPWLECFVLRRFVVPRIPEIECDECGRGEWNGLFGGGFSTKLECKTEMSVGGFSFAGDATVEIIRRSAILTGTGEWTQYEGGPIQSGKLGASFDLNILQRTIEYTDCQYAVDGCSPDACTCNYEDHPFPDIPVYFCDSSCEY